MVIQVPFTWSLVHFNYHSSTFLIS